MPPKVKRPTWIQKEKDKVNKSFEQEFQKIKGEFDTYVLQIQEKIQNQVKAIPAFTGRCTCRKKGYSYDHYGFGFLDGIAQWDWDCGCTAKKGAYWVIADYIRYYEKYILYINKEQFDLLRYQLGLSNCKPYVPLIPQLMKILEMKLKLYNSLKKVPDDSTQYWRKKRQQEDRRWRESFNPEKKQDAQLLDKKIEEKQQQKQEQKKQQIKWTDSDEELLDCLRKMRKQ